MVKLGGEKRQADGHHHHATLAASRALPMIFIYISITFVFTTTAGSYAYSFSGSICLCESCSQHVNIFKFVVRVFTHQVLFNIPFHILHPLPLFTFYICTCLLQTSLINLSLQYEGTPKYLGESVMGMKFGLRKRR